MFEINRKKYNRFKHAGGDFYLWPGIFTVMMIGVILCMYSFATPNREASAFTTKSSGQGLSPAEWNSLPNDFVDKAGDTMSGNLSLAGNLVTGLADPNIGTDAVNRRWVNNEIASVFVSPVGGEARTVTGAHLGIACGSSPASTVWTPYPTTSAGSYISAYINTSAAGFSATPYYFTAIKGNGSQWYTIGDNAIVAPTPTGFTVVLRTAATAAQAQTFGWRIDWCGVGN